MTTRESIARANAAISAAIAQFQLEQPGLDILDIEIEPDWDPEEEQLSAGEARVSVGIPSFSCKHTAIHPDGSTD